MLQFKQELYCQLYISNLKENKGTFSQINDLKEIVVELIEKAQTTKEIKNPSSPQIIYNVLEHICFGCGIQWWICLNGRWFTISSRNLTCCIRINDWFQLRK